MVTGARGEGTIEFEGETLPVVFTMATLDRLERAMGQHMMPIAQKTTQGDIGVSDVAQLLVAGLEQGRRESGIQRRAYNLNDAHEIMGKVGFIPVSQVVIRAMGEVLMFGQENAVAAAESSEDAAASDADRPPKPAGRKA